ncbi:MAG: hypothetical protein Q9Q40_03030 [Acidobacteriota bacterium]|nr:hypothetical protein [Acidobacteriota bacterium]
MKRPSRGVLFALAFLTAGPAWLGGCRLARVTTPNPVIVEGVVVAGDTFRVDPLDADPAGWTGPGLPATVRLENQDGDVIEVSADLHGRFRIGPLKISGSDGDRLLVRCPGTLGLQMSYLLPPEARAAESGDTIVVRRKITLPTRPTDPRPQG